MHGRFRKRKADENAVKTKGDAQIEYSRVLLVILDGEWLLQQRKLDRRGNATAEMDRRVVR